MSLSKAKSCLWTVYGSDIRYSNLLPAKHHSCFHVLSCQPDFSSLQMASRKHAVKNGWSYLCIYGHESINKRD